MISKVALPLTAATRPAMFAYRQMPITPTTTTQTSAKPKRDPTTVLVTKSPMSTNPPMAVRIPSATEKIFVIIGIRSRARQPTQAGHRGSSREKVVG